MELSPGIKLFFQLGNFFIMDSETLEVNSLQETPQAAISEVLKKNSLTERVTSIRNRVCENQANIAKTRLDNQRARRLRQLLDHCNTLRQEATALHLERQRQAMEVKQRLQPDVSWKYEGIRLRRRERHIAASIGPCYLDKRQQFPVRLRSTKDNSLTPTVRRARATLQQHQLEDRKKDNPYTSSRASQHGDKSAPAMSTATSTGLQEGTLVLPPVSAPSEHATRSQHGFATPTALPYAASFLVNPATPPPHNHSHSSNYNRAQSSLNNHMQCFLDRRKSSLSCYTVHFPEKHPHSSLPNYIFPNHRPTHSSLTNHTSSIRNDARDFLSNRISSLSNPIIHYFDNPTNHFSDKNAQRRRSSDIKPKCRYFTNSMRSKMSDGNTHLSKTDSPKTDSPKTDSPGERGSTHKGADDYSLLDRVDLHTHFCDAQKNKELSIGNSPSTQQSRANQHLWGFRRKRQAWSRLQGSAATETTDIQVKVATFLKNMNTLKKGHNTLNQGEVQPTSPSEPKILNPYNINTINPTKKDAQNETEIKPSTTPGLKHTNKSEVVDSVPRPDKIDENAAEIKTASKLGNTISRKTNYSWRDIPVPPRDGYPGGGFSAEDLVLQALTGIPIRNVFQTPVPLNSASRAMRHTATFKMRQLVERMISSRSRYERHQVEQLRHQMALELQGRTIAEEELVSVTAGAEPSLQALT